MIAFCVVLLAAVAPGPGSDREIKRAEARRWTNAIRAGRMSIFRWERLPGRVVEVRADSPLTPAKIDLDGSTGYLVVPHPGDRWHVKKESLDKYSYVDYRGYDSGIFRGQKFMSLCYRIGETGALRSVFLQPVVLGTGELFLAPNDTHLEDNVGSIRVKIAPVSSVSESPDRFRLPEAAWQSTRGTLGEKEWNLLPGEVLTVPANGYAEVDAPIDGSEWYVMIPHPTDRWDGWKNGRWKSAGHAGYGDPFDPQGMALSLRDAKGNLQRLAERPVVQPHRELVLFADSEERRRNVGSIRVKVIPVLLPVIRQINGHINSQEMERQRWEWIEKHRSPREKPAFLEQVVGELAHGDIRRAFVMRTIVAVIFLGTLLCVLAWRRI